MGWTARINVVPGSSFLKVIGVLAVWVIIALIVGFAGPSMYETLEYSTWNCSDSNHTFFNKQNCSGTQLSLGQESPMFTVNTGSLNKYWSCTLQPYWTNNVSGLSLANVFVTVWGRDDAQDNWTMVLNSTVQTLLDCPNADSDCVHFRLVLIESIQFMTYGVTLRLLNVSNQPIDHLGDVVVWMTKQNSQFSQLALALHFIYLLVASIILCVHLIQLRGHHTSPYTWTFEQKFLIVLVLCLMLLDDPLYPLQYLVSHWFVELLGMLFELAFTLALFCMWFSFLNKLKEDEFRWTMMIKAQLGLVALYGLFAFILYTWASTKAAHTQLRGLSDDLTPLDVFYLITGVLYGFLALAFMLQLVLTLAVRGNDTQETREDRKIRFYFFALPALIIILAVLTGIFSGTIGGIGNDTPSYVLFLSLYNGYVLLLLWGWWPITVDLPSDVSNPVESSRIFSDATHPEHYDHPTQ